MVLFPTQYVDDTPAQAAVRTWLQAAVSSVAPQARKQKRTSAESSEPGMPTSRFEAHRGEAENKTCLTCLRRDFHTSRMLERDDPTALATGPPMTNRTHQHQNMAEGTLSWKKQPCSDCDGLGRRRVVSSVPLKIYDSTTILLPGRRMHASAGTPPRCTGSNIPM